MFIKTNVPAIRGDSNETNNTKKLDWNFILTDLVENYFGHWWGGAREKGILGGSNHF